jgi:hypothetical protein
MNPMSAFFAVALATVFICGKENFRRRLNALQWGQTRLILLLPMVQWGQSRLILLLPMEYRLWSENQSSLTPLNLLV